MPGKVKPIPEGYRSLTPVFNVREAHKAIDFAKKAFGAEEKSRMDTPDGKVGHCELRIGDSMLMVSEATQLPHMPCGIFLYVKDVDETFKRAKAAGATVRSEPGNQFWGDRFCQVTDPCGNHWGIGTHIEDLAPEEMKKRAQEWMKKQQKK